MEPVSDFWRRDGGVCVCLRAGCWTPHFFSPVHDTRAAGAHEQQQHHHIWILIDERRHSASLLVRVWSSATTGYYRICFAILITVRAVDNWDRSHLFSPTQLRTCSLVIRSPVLLVSCYCSLWLLLGSIRTGSSISRRSAGRPTPSLSHTHSGHIHRARISFRTFSIAVSSMEIMGCRLSRLRRSSGQPTFLLQSLAVTITLTIALTTVRTAFKNTFLRNA